MLRAQAPACDIDALVDQHRIFDVLLEDRLPLTGRILPDGPIDLPEHFAPQYPDLKIDEGVRGADGRRQCLEWDCWRGRPIQRIPTCCLEHAAKAAIVLGRLHHASQQANPATLALARSAWGFVSDAWFVEQRQRWGPQAHHLRLKGAILRREIESHVLTLDPQNRAAIQRLHQARHDQRTLLRTAACNLDLSGSGTALSALLQTIADRAPGDASSAPTGRGT